MMSSSLRHSHLFGPGPKRILALDGGGVRGVISLGFLERIEALLQSRTGRPGFRLCEYFSLVGGTSTGAIIAAGLALGHSVSELIELYLNISHKSFVTRGWANLNWMAGKFVPKFDDRALRHEIARQFGNETLGSDKIRCGLAIVAKRLDTGSVWLFHNHPNGLYFAGSDSSAEYTPNRDIPIANLLRASTAAPSYFAPEFLEVAPGVKGLFVDGGVSPHNNPSLLLLMLATLKGYGFRWPMGEDNLMLVSLGTGSPPPRPIWGESYGGKPALVFAGEALLSMMNDASWLAQTMLQWMSSSSTAWPIDGEVGDLADDSLGGKNLLHYLRYDAPIDTVWLQAHLGLRLTPEEAVSLGEMDRPDMAPRLLEIARKAAEAQIKPEHFPESFDALPGNSLSRGA
jgi:Patatin-like phospholipase